MCKEVGFARKYGILILEFQCDGGNVSNLYLRAIVCATLMCLSCTVGNAEVLSLSEALGIAYTTNPQLEAARSGQEVVDEGVNQAEANWRPTIGVAGSYGYETLNASQFGVSQELHAWPVTAGAQLNENIWRGGRTSAEIGKAKALVRAGLAQLTLAEEKVLLAAATAYFDVIHDEAAVHFWQDGVAALQKDVDGVEIAQKVGEATRTDVTESQARLADAQSSLVIAEAQLQVSRSGFEHAVGRPAETLDQSPPQPALPSGEDKAVDIAGSLSPPVVAARETVQAADYAVADAVGVLLPSLSLNAQYQFVNGSLTSVQGTGPQRAATVIGQLTIPIYQGGAEDSQVRQAKSQRAQAELQLADTQRISIDTAKTAWQAYLAAARSIDSYSREVQAAEIASRGAQEEMRAGSRTIFDVLLAEQELIGAQIALASSERDRQVAAYQILSAVGWLTAQKLALHVQIYDPSKYYEDNADRWFGLGD